MACMVPYVKYPKDATTNPWIIYIFNLISTLLTFSLILISFHLVFLDLVSSCFSKTMRSIHYFFSLQGQLSDVLSISTCSCKLSSYYCLVNPKGSGKLHFHFDSRDFKILLKSRIYYWISTHLYSFSYHWFLVLFYYDFIIYMKQLWFVCMC